MKKAVIFIGLLALGVVAWVAAGPYIATWQLRTAIQDQDEAKIARHVDFPALRRDLKRQVVARMKQSMSKELSDNPLVALGAEIASKVGEGLINSIVTPAGFARLMKEQGDFDQASYGYDSANEFSIRIPGETGGELHLILTRRGLTWKLRRIALPLDKLLKQN